MSKNKNKNTQDYTSSKTENETANEDKELIKYLYDKEIERLRIITDRTKTAIGFIFADSFFVSFVYFGEKNLLLNDCAIKLFAIVLSLIFLTFTVSTCFSSKINKSKFCPKERISFDYKSLQSYTQYLHTMNTWKEINLFVLYVFLGIVLVASILHKTVFHNPI